MFTLIKKAKSKIALENKQLFSYNCVSLSEYSCPTDETRNLLSVYMTKKYTMSYTLNIQLLLEKLIF